MNIKSQIIISCLILCLILSIGAVSAVDMNDTQYGIETSESLVVNSEYENLTVDEDVDFKINSSGEHLEILGATPGTFDNLKNQILNFNPAGVANTLVLTQDFVFSDGDTSGGIDITQSNCVIDGNGKIDSSQMSDIADSNNDDGNITNVTKNNILSSPNNLGGGTR